jgi:hypothetical protein
MSEKNRDSIRKYSDRAFLTSKISFAIFIFTLLLSSPMEKSQASTQEVKAQISIEIPVRPILLFINEFSLYVFLFVGGAGFILEKQISPSRVENLIRKSGLEKQFAEKMGDKLYRFRVNYEHEIVYFLTIYLYLSDNTNERYVIRNYRKCHIAHAFNELCFPALLSYMQKSKYNQFSKEELYNYIRKMYELLIKNSTTTHNVK